ncbi:LuxR C-terminal-related transcriptional regulator [Brevibacterium album]|uniref:LuxR C-terminal-related transcriptional regulator n=1 Tax=Brevibacterium album TaxID=417948 RepID=UPI00040685ED|nr:LuxR C-terminal-related transcriptional regulator [Brevibacterium album]
MSAGSWDFGAPVPAMLGEAAARTRALLSEEQAAALVLPGLWGHEGVRAATAAHSGGAALTLEGGRGGPEPYSDLAAALTAAGRPAGTVVRALREWEELCGEGALVLVRTATSLDEATAALLARAVRVTSLRVFVLMAHERDLCPPLRALVRAGVLALQRVSPLGPQAFADRLRTGAGLTGPGAVLDRVHDLTGGHLELADRLLASAASVGMLEETAGGWLWSWDEGRLRTALRPVYPQLLAHFDGDHRFTVRSTGLAGVLPEAPVEAAAGSGAVLDLLDQGILTWRHDSAPGHSSLQLAPEMLRWAVAATTSAAENAAAWYEFGEGLATAPEDRAVRTALSAWRLSVEAGSAIPDAAGCVRTALFHGWYLFAERLLTALPGGAAPRGAGEAMEAALPRGAGEATGAEAAGAAGAEAAEQAAAPADPAALEAQVLRAELAWAQGEVDRALRLLAASSHQLWPAGREGAPADPGTPAGLNAREGSGAPDDSGAREASGAGSIGTAAQESAPAPGAGPQGPPAGRFLLGGDPGGPAYDAALLVGQIGLFHPERALAVVLGEDPAAVLGEAPASAAEVEEERFRLGLACGRAAGLTLLADVIGLLHEGRWEDAFTAVRRRSLDVGLEESALARLWVGASLGLGGAHDDGRHVLAELLEELLREQAQPHLAGTVRGVLLIVAMHMGWDPHEFLTSVHRTHRRRPWQPGLASVQELTAAVLAMQDDRMLGCLHHARGALAATADADPFGLRPVALAMLAAAASYLPHRPEAACGERARAELRELGPVHGIPYLRFFAQALALVGSGPPTLEVSEAITDVAWAAREAGYAAQEQQALLLAVPGGSPRALAAVLAEDWQVHNERAGMVRALAVALAASADPGAGDAVLDAAEAFFATHSRFLAHVVLGARWQAETAGGGEPSARLLRLVLRARAEAAEYSWLLSRFAQELDLSERDRIIVRGLRDGERTGAVAGRLGLSPRTVERLIAQLLHRFRCADRLELVRLLEGFVAE